MFITESIFLSCCAVCTPTTLQAFTDESFLLPTVDKSRRNGGHRSQWRLCTQSSLARRANKLWLGTDLLRIWTMEGQQSWECESWEIIWRRFPLYIHVQLVAAGSECTVRRPFSLTTKSFNEPRKWFSCNLWPFQMLPTSARLPGEPCQLCSPRRHQSPCAEYLTWKHLLPRSAGCAPANDRWKMFCQFSSAGSNESPVSLPHRLGSPQRLSSSVSFSWLLSEVSWR